MQDSGKLSFAYPKLDYKALRALTRKQTPINGDKNVHRIYLIAILLHLLIKSKRFSAISIKFYLLNFGEENPTNLKLKMNFANRNLF